MAASRARLMNESRVELDAVVGCCFVGSGLASLDACVVAETVDEDEDGGTDGAPFLILATKSSISRCRGSNSRNLFIIKARFNNKIIEAYLVACFSAAALSPPLLAEMASMRWTSEYRASVSRLPCVIYIYKGVLSSTTTRKPV